MKRMLNWKEYRMFQNYLMQRLTGQAAKRFGNFPFEQYSFFGENPTISPLADALSPERICIPPQRKQFQILQR